MVQGVKSALVRVQEKFHPFFLSLFLCFLLPKVYFSLLLMASVTQVASVPFGITLRDGFTRWDKISVIWEWKVQLLGKLKESVANEFIGVKLSP